MPGNEKRREHDRDRDNTAERAATVKQRAQEDLKLAKNERQPAERERMAHQHEMLRGAVKNKSADHQQAAADLMEQQRTTLNKQQAAERRAYAAMSRAGANLDRGVGNREAVERAAEVMKMAMRAQRDELAARQETQVEELQRLLAHPDVSVDEVADKHADQDADARRDNNAELSELRRNIETASTRLDRDQLDAVRDVLAHETGNRALDDRAVQNVVDEALRARREEDALNRAKGQLFEELLAQEGQKRAAELSRTTGRDVQFIDGNRIRDEQGRKLTDGMLAYRDEQNRLRVVEAFEAKAGARAATELSRRMEKMTKDFEAETRRYARDLARDVVTEEAKTVARTVAERARRQDELVKTFEAQLRRADVQAENGQVETTRERLHESTDRATRIYIDGKAADLARDQGRPQVTGVVPHDVEVGRTDRLRLQVDQASLVRAAAELLRRLREDNQW